MTKRSLARPGGRSSQVKTAVFEAVEDLMAETGGAVPSMSDIAARAEVNPTSLYRRWGTADTLAADVAIERLMRDFPIPDTGTLRGDIEGWAANATRSLSGKRSIALLRILVGMAQSGDATGRERLPALIRRGQELQGVLARAQARGEATPTLPEVLEIVMAPIYLHVLFFGPIRDAGYAARLVDRLMALTPAKRGTMKKGG
jgi:AcrR family transcriptional regulator